MIQSSLECINHCIVELRIVMQNDNVAGFGILNTPVQYGFAGDRLIKITRQHCPHDYFEIQFYCFYLFACDPAIWGPEKPGV